MKLYIAELMIPKELFNCEGFTLFLPYSREYTPYDSNHMIGTYGWTTRKSVMKKFISNRYEKNYRIRKISIDKDDVTYHMFSEKFSDCKIGHYEYNNDNTKVELYTTKNEYGHSTFYLDENMFENALPAHINYRIFSPKIIDLLDTIGYTTIFDTHYSYSDSDGAASDYASYQLSFKKTVYGKDIPSSMYNELNGLLLFFRYPILGAMNGYNLQ